MKVWRHFPTRQIRAGKTCSPTSARTAYLSATSGELLIGPTCCGGGTTAKYHACASCPAPGRHSRRCWRWLGDLQNGRRLVRCKLANERLRTCGAFRSLRLRRVSFDTCKGSRASGTKNFVSALLPLMRKLCPHPPREELSHSKTPGTAEGRGFLLPQIQLKNGADQRGPQGAIAAQLPIPSDFR